MCPGNVLTRRLLQASALLGSQLLGEHCWLWAPACRARSPCPLSPGCLVDRTGKILIPGISQAVAPVTQEELELYDKIDFDMEEYAKDVGADTLLHSCKVPGCALSCRGPVGRGRRGGPRFRCIYVCEPAHDADPEQDAPRPRLGGWRSGGSAVSA